jgi:Phage integrase family
LQRLTSRTPPLRDKTLSSHLRNFFRYLFKAGRTATNLALAIPSMAQRYGARLPRHLTTEEVDTLVAAVRTDSAGSRRNYAMVLLLARLGLRAPEVIAMQLDDIDWRSGDIIVRGKGNRHDRVPLPPEVGEALADYIKSDRKTTSRALFVTEKGTSSAIQEWPIAEQYPERCLYQNRPQAAGALCGVAHWYSGVAARQHRRPVSIKIGLGSLQVQPCPQYPVIHGRPEKGRLSRCQEGTSELIARLAKLKFLPLPLRRHG